MYCNHFGQSSKGVITKGSRLQLQTLRRKGWRLFTFLDGEGPVRLRSEGESQVAAFLQVLVAYPELIERLAIQRYRLDVLIFRRSSPRINCQFAPAAQLHGPDSDDPRRAVPHRLAIVAEGRQAAKRGAR